MKRIKFLILFFTLMLGASCTLDLQTDPNLIQPSQAVPDLLLNSMQRQLAVLVNNVGFTGMTLMRQANSAGSNYSNAIGPSGFDFAYTTAYAGILQDGKTLIEQADALGYARHSGMARVISAYVMVLLVDAFGDVPFSQAFQGAAEFSPGLDKGADIYTAALALLTKAELDLTTLNNNAVPIPGYKNPLATVPQDQYYASSANYNKWLKVINTIRLKVFLNLRLTDPAGAAAGINAAIQPTAVNSQGLILTTADAFVFHYGTNTSDPDARNTRFVNNYPAGGGDYMANWLMWQMWHGYEANAFSSKPGDPRMRYYFYRQSLTNGTNPNDVRCATALAAPDHYPQEKSGAVVINNAAGFPTGITDNPGAGAWDSNGVGAGGNLPRTFCFPTLDGYWGRDHVDPQGIPPDGFLRTAWGSYPFGGAYDDGSGNTFGVGSGAGMRGAGIQPILLRSYVNFMLAEASLMIPGILPGPGVSAVPATHFDLGIQNSFDDVRLFIENGGMPGTGQAPGPTTQVNAGGTSINFTTDYPSATYASNILLYKNAPDLGPGLFRGGANTQFIAGTTDEKLRLIAREYWVASFGNGIESYNLYRRTGYPAGLQPTIQATTGNNPFPRSYYYPQALVALNAKVEQKANLSVRVFWDNNTSNLDY